MRATPVGAAISAGDALARLANTFGAGAYAALPPGQIARDLLGQAGVDAGVIDDGPDLGSRVLFPGLSLLAHLVGTPYFPAIDGGILFVEEIGEEPYAVERRFLQLLHAGVLGRQRALLLGDFDDCTPKNTERYPYCMEEVLETLR